MVPMQTGSCPQVDDDDDDDDDDVGCITKNHKLVYLLRNGRSRFFQELSQINNKLRQKETEVVISHIFL
jgi:hypothetical protein